MFRNINTTTYPNPNKEYWFRFGANSSEYKYEFGLVKDYPDALAFAKPTMEYDVGFSLKDSNEELPYLDLSGLGYDGDLVGDLISGELERITAPEGFKLKGLFYMIFIDNEYVFNASVEVVDNNELILGVVGDSVI